MDTHIAYDIILYTRSTSVLYILYYVLVHRLTCEEIVL